MTCRDFERRWQDRLDARVTPGLNDGIEMHVEGCAHCRVTHARFLTLERAIRSCSSVSVPVRFDLADRVLADFGPGRRRRAIRTSSWLAAAAATLLVATFALRGRVIPPSPRPGPTPAATRLPNLNDAMAEATSASIDLARETTRPVGRLGRRVLGSAGRLSLASLSSRSARVEPAASVWDGVRDRVGAGVNPLSGTARNAFGFLIPAAETGKNAERSPRGGA